MIPFDFAIRPAVPDDLPFVLDAWVQDYRHAPATRFIPDVIYFREHRKLILNLIQHSTTLIGYDPQDNNHLFGFICFSGEDILHYLYTKGAYRNLGIARDLLLHALPMAISQGKTIQCTHASKLFSNHQLIASYRCTYNPYLLQDVQ